jgi:hypothetical protein
MNVQDLINQSLTLAKRLGAGRGAGQSESNVVLQLLNNMLDSWSTKRLTVYNVAAASYSVTAGTDAYTIGPGGTWSATRPTAIESANIVTTVSSGNVQAKFPVKLIGQKEWANLETFGDTSVIPKLLYYDQAYPLGTVNIFPTPSQNVNLELYTWTPFTQFTAPAGTVNTVGTAVTWESGPYFDPELVGNAITINSVAYAVASVASNGQSLVLSTSAGTQTGVAYSVSVFLGSVLFPPGYVRAVSYNLAVEICPAFGLPVPDDVMQIAEGAKAAVEALNARFAPADDIANQNAAEKQGTQGNKQ